MTRSARGIRPPATGAPDRPGPDCGTGRVAASPEPPVRLTWAQPEDLVGHELRQAAEDGRNPAAALRAWLAAGGHPAPDRAGASPTPAPPELRALACRLLDDLAQLPLRSAADEPRSWPAIRATWPPTAYAPPEPPPTGAPTAGPGIPGTSPAPTPLRSAADEPRSWPAIRATWPPTAYAPPEPPPT
ncbi:hypothetical protein ACIGEE_16475, partial [Streptomyces sp. NPDC085540]